MQENDKPVLIYSTFPNSELAENVGRMLVEQRLAACVNIIPGITSIYNWEGAVQRDTETVMIVKTRDARASLVVAEVRKLHSFENPAVVVLPITGGSEAYLKWLLNETAS